MATTLVDSNVIIDIATEDADWSRWSSSALRDAADAGPLVINPIVYAEVSILYKKIEDVEDVLRVHDFRREGLSYEVAFLAGKAFLSYRRRGGARAMPLPDFFIGAHAAVAGYRLLTRDASRHRTYFPGLEILAP